jgi:hypothetical protein
VEKPVVETRHNRSSTAIPNKATYLRPHGPRRVSLGPNVSGSYAWGIVTCFAVANTKQASQSFATIVDTGFTDASTSRLR